jgi:hypothetical protein
MHTLPNTANLPGYICNILVSAQTLYQQRGGTRINARPRQRPIDADSFCIVCDLFFRLAWQFHA